MKAQKMRQLLESLGIPPALFWGFVGLFLFIFGTTIDQSWFSAFLVAGGYSQTATSLIFTVYGAAVAVAACFTGALAARLGIRQLMLLSTGLYLAVTILLVAVALPRHWYWLVMLTYSLRGAAYPLFAYAFLMWVNYRTEKAMLGRAVSWFWIFFALGMTICGPLLAKALLPVFGGRAVLLFGCVLAVLGTLCSVWLNHAAAQPKAPMASGSGGFLHQVQSIVQHPRLALSILVKAINDIGKFGLVIVMPLYLLRYHFPVSEWLLLWSIANLLNIPLNYLFGWLGDRIGWRKTVTWFSGTFCGLSILGMRLVPLWFGHNFWALLAVLALYAFGLAGYIPLSAMIPNLVPADLEAGITALNVGSGLSNLLGPALVSLFIGPFGAGGVLVVMALVYFLGSSLTPLLKTPAELQAAKSNPKRPTSSSR